MCRWCRAWPLPPVLAQPNSPLVVGLWVSPDRLVQVRRNRLASMGEERDTDYIDLDRVRAEIAATRQLFEQQDWPSIDVSRRSIEETAASVMNLLTERREKAVRETVDPGIGQRLAPGDAQGRRGEFCGASRRYRRSALWHENCFRQGKDASAVARGLAEQKALAVSRRTSRRHGAGRGFHLGAGKRTDQQKPRSGVVAGLLRRLVRQNPSADFGRRAGAGRPGDLASCRAAPA